MKIHIVTGKRDDPREGRFIIGAFSSPEEASSAVEEAKEKMGNQFSFFTETRVLNQRIRYHGYEEGEDSDDDISLEERVQALSDYMDVAQMKIMRLQNTVQSLAFHLLQFLGESRTKAIMDEVIKDFGRKK